MRTKLKLKLELGEIKGIVDICIISLFVSIVRFFWGGKKVFESERTEYRVVHLHVLGGGEDT